VSVCRTVYAIFSVKEWRDLETGGKGRSRSLKIAQSDRLYTTFYWSAIVNIALYGIVFELFDVEWYNDLEIRIRGHSRSFKPVPFESLGAVSYLPFIVTMAPCCIICEIERDIGRKSRFFHTLLHSALPLGGPRRNIAIRFGVKKLEWWGYPTVKNFEYMYNRLDTIPACDRWTDRRTDRQTDRHLATA